MGAHAPTVHVAACCCDPDGGPDPDCVYAEATARIVADLRWRAAHVADASAKRLFLFLIDEYTAGRFLGGAHLGAGTKEEDGHG